MALMNKPDEKIFASKAKEREVEVFPDHSRGWGVSFEQTEGIPPMEWFNALFKRLDENILYVLQRGVPDWSATITYPKGAYVQHEGLSYKSLKETTNKQPNEANSEHWARWGLMASDLVKATLTQFGITQLFTGYDSDREDLALTPKTAKMLKDLIDSNTRSLGNYIPNSKKSNAVDSPSGDTVATSAAVKAANDNANNRVSKFGDFIQWLTIQREHAGLTIKSTHKEVATLDMTVWNGAHPQSSIEAVDIGNHATDIRFHNTPQGDNYNTDRRQHIMTLGSAGHIWTKAYGWLSDFFLVASTFWEFRNRFSYQALHGTDGTSRYFTIPVGQNVGLKISIGQLNVQGVGHKLNLSESFGHFLIGVAVDRGAARHSIGVEIVNDRQVIFHTGHPASISYILVGEFYY